MDTTRPLSAPHRARRPSPLLGLAAACLALSLPIGALAAPPAQALDLAQARAELAAGVLVWDLRETGPVLPGALRVDARALAAWRERGDVPALAAAVSAAGVNLSARVLVVGDADDEGTAVLAQRLAALSRGSVAWLRGGAPAWEAQGLPVQARPSSRLPVPQRLVALDAAAAGTPADGARRRTVTFALYEPLPQVSQAGGGVAAVSR